MSVGEDGGVVAVVQIFQHLFTDVFKYFFVGDSCAFGLIEGPVAAMKGELFLRELVLVIINFLDVEGLSVHVDDKFLIGVDFVFLERPDSDYDLDAISLA